MGKARAVRGTAAALAVGAVLLAGCSGSKGSGAAPTTTSRPATSVSTTSTVPQLRAAALPPCPPGATGFTTVPDWLTGTLPAGTTLVRGTSTGVGPHGDGEPTAFVTVLVGQKDGNALPTISVYRTPGTTAATGDPSGEWDPSVPKRTNVRGRPGVVGQTVSRSGPGLALASWGEDGDTWVASSTLGVDELATALDGLTLGADGVTDPSGSFTQVGTGLQYPTGNSRVTELQVRTAASSPTTERVLYVRIDPAGPGASGPLQLPAGGVAATTKVDGRVVLVNQFQATAATDDGSQVEIRSYDGESRPATLDRATVTTVLAGLHRRGPADAKVVEQLPLGDAGPDGAVPPGFCREG